MRILVACCFLLAVTAAAATELTLETTASLELPPGEVRGFAWAGGDTLAWLLASADEQAFGDSLEVFLRVGDASGQVYWQEEFTGILSRGLAWDGASFWSTGDDTDGGSLLYKVSPDSMAVTEVYHALGHRPMDLAYDGRWLWLTDRDRGCLDRFDPENGDATRTVAAPGFSPGGLAWDGEAIWVADAGTGRLVRLRGGRLERQTHVDQGSWFRRGTDVIMAHGQGGLWVLGVGDTS